jgi:hypothetical protein
MNAGKPLLAQAFCESLPKWIGKNERVEEERFNWNTLLNCAGKVADAFDDEEFSAGTTPVGLKRTKSQKAGITRAADKGVLILIHFLLAAVKMAPLP